MRSLLAIGDVARLADVCTKTVERAIRLRRLPSVKIGKSVRIFPEDAERWIATRGAGEHA